MVAYKRLPVGRTDVRVRGVGRALRDSDVGAGEQVPVGRVYLRRSGEAWIFDVLAWAHAKGCTWDEMTCYWAARVGYLEMLRWARANGCPWDAQTCSGAALEWHLEVLHWERAKGCPCDEEKCVNEAYKMGQEGGYQEEVLRGNR